MKFGKTYYQGLRALYENPDSADMRLEAPEHLEESPELLKAMIQLFKHPPNRSYMKSYAENCTVMNTADEVACCRCLLRLEPNASIEQRDLCVSLLRLLARNTTFTRCLELLDIMQARLDKILVAVSLTLPKTPFAIKYEWHPLMFIGEERILDGSVFDKDIFLFTSSVNDFYLKVYCSTRSSDETPASWLLRLSPVWETVLPAVAVRKIIAVDSSQGGKLDDVASELDECLGSSQLGHRLFAFALQKVLDSRIRTTIADGINTLKGKEKLERADVVTCRQNICEKIRGLASIESLTERRKVSVNYRGVTFEIATKSWMEEVDRAVDIEVRGWMVEQSVLDPLIGENLVCVATTDLKVTTFGADLTKDAIAARKFIRTLGAKDVSERSAEKLEADIAKHPCPKLKYHRNLS
eukprot:6490887-Amphidinium_carterae.2